jgi:putative PIN family toxin of toxin-antitoxin system
VRAVIDNNLFVSGLLWPGKPGRLLAAVAGGHIRIFITQELLTELREVLQREKFAARLALKQLTAESALATVHAAARIVQAAPIPAPASLRDLDDLPVLACAVAAGVDAIITGDDDLLSLKSFEGIPIVDAAEALKRLGLS